MGYRSDVVLLISLENYNNMIDYIPTFYNEIKSLYSNVRYFKFPSLEDFTKEIKNVLEEGKDNEKALKNYILLRWYDIKWYNEEFEDFYATSYIDRYIHNCLISNEYRFIRLGDDLNDIEVSGYLYTDECNISIKREIVIN